MKHVDGQIYVLSALEGNQRLDNPTVAIKPGWKGFDHSVCSSAVSDPGSELNLAGFEIVDNAVKLIAGRITAAEESKFVAVKVGIVKSDIALK